jgi:signal transduction histidine kinase
MRFQDVRELSLFDGVTDEQLAALVEASEVIECEAGVVLWPAGDPADFWWINVEGTIDLSRTVGGERVVLGQFTSPGRWAGGFRAWDESGTYLATGTTTSRCVVLKVPAAALRSLLAELPLVAHLVDGLFRTARSIESSARERQSLVRLGTLSAGLAHELNNPAAAATRAVDALDEQLEDALSSLFTLATKGITARQYTGLDELRRQLLERSAPTGSLDRADLEDELSSWMARQGLQREWVMAPALAAAGADVEWCDAVLELLGPESVQYGVEWVASTVTVRALLGEVRESTRRVSELVASVKVYTQMDRGALQSTDVTDGIDSTLTMLAHKLGDTVEVRREYAADLPRIEAYVGELNQVWTNLIDNAVDAMDGEGVLTVRTRAEVASVVVEVADTGSGMTPEVRQRAFETFFTTKETGKGTGLGLDIARRIVVERHGGRIDIDSEPGSTTFSVTLPLRPPERR